MTEHTFLFFSLHSSHASLSKRKTKFMNMDKTNKNSKTISAVNLCVVSFFLAVFCDKESHVTISCTKINEKFWFNDTINGVSCRDRERENERRLWDRNE